jgi:hypothetical protein
MAASATRMLMVNAPFERIYAMMGMALANAGGMVKSYDPNYRMFSASFGMGFTSWGENMTIVCIPTPTGCSLNVTSECALPTQLIDWGKNDGNIVKLATELSRLLQVPVF